VQRRQAGQESIELAGVSGREHARQPAVRGVVDRQRHLHAGEPFVGHHERIDGTPELIGFRHILGVVDDRERAASEWQCDVERLRFGPRPVERRRDDFKRRTQLESGERPPGVVVIRLHDEFHVEFLGRIIRYYGANATSGLIGSCLRYGQGKAPEGVRG
jgi:hypothetical protein